MLIKFEKDFTQSLQENQNLKNESIILQNKYEEIKNKLRKN